MFDVRVRLIVECQSRQAAARPTGAPCRIQLHESEFGRFGCVIDPDAVKVALCAPAAGA